MSTNDLSWIKKIPVKALENGEAASSSMGEIWLAMQDNPELSEDAAIRGGMGKFCNLDKEYFRFHNEIPTSLQDDVKTIEGNSLGPLIDKLSIGELDAGYESTRCSDEKIEAEYMLSCISPCLRAMLERLGKSIRTALDSSVIAGDRKYFGKSKSTYGRNEKKWIAQMFEMRAEGKSDDEIIAFLEEKLGKFFPEIVAQHEAQAQKAVEESRPFRASVREMKKAQMSLF